ncbi:MAG: Uma2 family endonuclease [Polyangiales bacterium]
MSAVSSVSRLSYDAYLALERSSDLKHEFLDGEVWAMAGGTPPHSRVKTDLLAAVSFALRGKPCLEYDSDLKVRVEATRLTTYPDLTVICGPMQRSKIDPNAATNPTLLVEVISPSTESWDTGAKFRHYGRIESLREILYIWPDDRAVQLRTRNDDGSWLMRDLKPGEPIVLGSIDVVLEQAQLFGRLDQVEATSV